MRIFVAGATGYVGSAVVQALLEEGHAVTGLARSDASAAALTRIGVEVHRGDIDDLDSLRTAAAASDGVIYAANKHISTALRLRAETAVLALGERGVRSSSVRLAPTVHGHGDARGFISILIGIARDKGISAFVGDGSNRWPAVHLARSAPPRRGDAVPAGRGVRPGWHRAARGGRRGCFLAPLVAIDNPSSSVLTQERFGWLPKQPTLIADIEEGHYFEH
jgi:nucleoside-diphosphate-sugar epimerase